MSGVLLFQRRHGPTVLVAVLGSAGVLVGPDVALVPFACIAGVGLALAYSGAAPLPEAESRTQTQMVDWATVQTGR